MAQKTRVPTTAPAMIPPLEFLLEEDEEFDDPCVTTASADVVEGPSVVDVVVTTACSVEVVVTSSSAVEVAVVVTSA